MCLHSGSFNTRPESRYVYFQSYHPASARYLRRGLAPYQRNYDWTGLRAHVSPSLRSLLLSATEDPRAVVAFIRNAKRMRARVLPALLAGGHLVVLVLPNDFFTSSTFR